ncbi:hypothetical protein MMC30_001604 [Trapelia coarctata]|nr:hypothetical protein [Trapelia coarctata]
MKHAQAFTNGTGLGHLPYEKGGSGGGGHGSSSGGHGDDSTSSGGGGGHSGAGTLLAPKWLVTAGLLIALHEYVPLPILFPLAASYAKSEAIDPQDEGTMPIVVAQSAPVINNKTYFVPPTDKKCCKFGKGGGGSGAGAISIALIQYIALPMLVPFFVGYANAASIKTGDEAPLPTATAQDDTSAIPKTIAWSTLSAVPITVDEGSLTSISMPPTIGMATAVTDGDAVATAAAEAPAAQNGTDKLLYISFGGAAASLRLPWVLLGLPFAIVALLCSGPLAPLLLGR